MKVLMISHLNEKKVDFRRKMDIILLKLRRSLR